MTALVAARAAAPSAPKGRRPAGLLLGLAAALTVAAVLAALLFRLAGGSWYVVQTPSMGTAAPVGTLLVDEPVRISALRVGDVITFHPPTAPGEVYSHRVVATEADGVRTRGDINGADDGWVVHQRDLLGRATAVLPVAGWAVRALPIVVTGCLLTVLLTRWPSAVRRRLARTVGVGLSVALAAAWLHPFAGMVLLQTVTDGRSAVVTVVSTGILPIRAVAPGGASVHLEPGAVGLLRVVGLVPGQRVPVSSALDLPPWGWGLLAVACLVPLGVCLAAMAHAARFGRRRTSA